MLAIERRNEILEKLQKDKKVVVGELSKKYHVSEETIRRDLEKLENDGYAIKSYGGAVLNENSNLEVAFDIRKNYNVDEKQKISELLIGLVKDGESIILDASSTAVIAAKRLKEKERLTVITNSIEITAELFEKNDWNVMSTGGTVRQKSFALVGTQTDRMLECYHVDKAIVSCKGINENGEFSDSDELHAGNKRTMLKRATEKILAIDHTKFGKTAFSKIGMLSDVTMIVTDVKPEEKWIEIFSNEGIKCIYPQI